MRVLFRTIYPYLFLLLFFTIPFDDYVRALPNILLIVLAVLFPIVIQKEDFVKLKKIPAIVWGMFFVLTPLLLLFNGTIAEDTSELNKILLSGALVVLYLPIGDFKKINKAIIFSSVVAIFYSLIKLFILLNQGVSISFLESATIIEAILVDRIYLGFLAVLSILGSYQLLRPYYHPDNRYYLANIVLNVLFILFIVSRIAIVVLLAIFILSLFHSKKRGPQILFATGGLLLVAALTFVLNKDFRKKVLYSSKTEVSQGLIANTMAYEPRTIIWDCAWQIAKKNNMLWTGLGFARTNEEMMKCYESSIQDQAKKEWFVKQKYNVHNEFLDLYLGVGIIGLILFLAALLTLFYRNRKSFYPSALLLTLVCFSAVENVFHRQIGAYYVGFVLLSLLIHQQPLDNEKEPNEKKIP